RSAATIAGVRDHRAQEAGGDGCAERGGVDGTWRRDEGTQCAIEPPLGTELLPAPRHQPRVDASPSMFDRLESGVRGKLAATDRESQSVPRDRIDETRSVAGEQEAIRLRTKDIDCERTKEDGRLHEAG